MGAEVFGFALPPETTPSLWDEIGSELLVRETRADLNHFEAVRDAVGTARPHIVLHMAAQALVRRSYADPIGTIASNVLGTVHLLDALRARGQTEAALVVTTDKVYENNDMGRDFVEDDPLGGHDPYSASKAAAELLTRSYASSFLEPAGIRTATARAGNVIGGGDWSADRLVPDAWRAARNGTPLRLRFPAATRPWQHVLEPLAGYFAYIEALVGKDGLPRALNFGPVPGDTMTVAQVADKLGEALGTGQAWEQDQGNHPAEMKLLSIDPALARKAIGWAPRLDGRSAVDWTTRWYAAHGAGQSARALCLGQITEYEALP
jgi:CDP-glucose 4,6-dehydratase